MFYHAAQSSQARQLESRWAQQLQAPSAARAEALKKKLVAAGCQLTRVDGQTKIVFAGPVAEYRSVVNLLLAEPWAWSEWHSERLPHDQVRGTLTIKML